MKLITTACVGILLILGLSGCSSDKTAPTDSEALNYEVIGDDGPADFDAAIAELQSLGIEVPDPVSAEQLAALPEIDLTAAAGIIQRATLDDDARLRFRRIIGHLHDQFQSLRRCMNQNDDPRLRRMAYGANHAYHRGLRALQAGEPRVALRYFHQSNRILNLALRLCRGDDGGGRP